VVNVVTSADAAESVEAVSVTRVRTISVPSEVKVVTSADSAPEVSVSDPEVIVETMVEPPEVKVVTTAPPRIALPVVVNSSPSELVRTLV
jgi:hypothetical protein